MDKSTSRQLLEYILKSITLIRRRFQGIRSSDDFMATDEGIDRLDAISMRLQSIVRPLKI